MGNLIYQDNFLSFQGFSFFIPEQPIKVYLVFFNHWWVSSCIIWCDFLMVCNASRPFSFSRNMNHKMTMKHNVGKTTVSLCLGKLFSWDFIIISYIIRYLCCIASFLCDRSSTFSNTVQSTVLWGAIFH